MAVSWYTQALIDGLRRNGSVTAHVAYPRDKKHVEAIRHHLRRAARLGGMSVTTEYNRLLRSVTARVVEPAVRGFTAPDGTFIPEFNGEQAQYSVDDALAGVDEWEE